jgi:hypothetical protein
MLIILALLTVIIGSCQAVTASFTVKSGEEVAHSMDLIVEDRVSIQVKVVGGTANTLHFSISFPNSTVTEFGASGDFSYSFVCDAEGEYVLHFVNTDQAENKVVTLNYEVTHYIFGIPQMLLMLIIIVLVCVFGIVAFVLMGRPY